MAWYRASSCSARNWPEGEFEKDAAALGDGIQPGLVDHLYAGKPVTPCVSTGTVTPKNFESSSMPE